MDDTTGTAFRDRVSGGDPLFGAWCSGADAVAVGVVAAAGFDYVVVDLQHGGATEALVPALCAEVRAAGAVPLARVRSGSFPDVGRALDLGVAGVIVPNVEDEVAAAEAVRCARYPPAGERSIGRLVDVGDDPLLFVMVESQSALDALPRTLEVEGIDGVYVGPADLSLSLGCQPRHDDPVFDRAITAIADQCRSAGVPLGVHDVMGTEVERYVALGNRLVNAFSDLPGLGEAARVALTRTGSARAGG